VPVVVLEGLESGDFSFITGAEAPVARGKQAVAAEDPQNVSPEFYAKHPNPFIKLFADLPYGKNAYAVPKIGIWPEYTSEIDAAFSKIMLEEKTPQEALDDVAHRMQPKLEQYEHRLQARGEK